MAVWVYPDLKQNSYCTLARANEILSQRPHTDEWFAAGTEPSATSYLVDDPGATLIIGDTTIPVDSGLGDFTAGDIIRFNGDTAYLLNAAAMEPITSIVLNAPGLLSVPGDNVEIFRYNGNEREQALIHATAVLDAQMNWSGTKAELRALQKLQWPRFGAFDCDNEEYASDAIPDIIEEVCAELALDVLIENRAKTPDVLGQGVSDVTMPGPFKAKVDSNAVEPMLSDYLLNKLRCVGSLSGSASRNSGFSSRMVRV